MVNAFLYFFEFLQEDWSLTKVDNFMLFLHAILVMFGPGLVAIFVSKCCMFIFSLNYLLDFTNFLGLQ